MPFIIAYAISLLASFVLLMIASALHLRYYSQIGREKYWAIVCVPMVSFFGALVPTLAAYTSGSFDLYAEDLATVKGFCHSQRVCQLWGDRVFLHHDVEDSAASGGREPCAGLPVDCSLSNHHAGHIHDATSIPCDVPSLFGLLAHSLWR